MPKWTKFAVGWAIAATVALAFSWGAVAQVRNRVIQPSVEIPTTAGLATTTAPPPEVTASTPRVVTLEPEVVDSTTSTTLAATTEGTQETTAPTTAPSTTSPTTTTAGPTTTSTTTTTLPPTTTTTTTTTTTAPPQTQTSSYTLVGGVVTISHAPGVVNFVSAIPQPGFSTDPRETGPDRVRIRFESQDHTSDFRAEWEGGELKITQNETGED